LKILYILLYSRDAIRSSEIWSSGQKYGFKQNTD
jgi:hypothetical protein